ncbi:MAG TPA: hypothetical protein VFA45_11195 [Actinomycetes bacterium]|nr:hypothetical protein [Actinomycetes bacterium]
MSRLDDWLAAHGLGDAEVMAQVPNEQMDRLSRSDQVRLSALLEQERTYHRHAGDPVADWNAARTRDEIDRLTDRGW